MNQDDFDKVKKVQEAVIKAQKQFEKAEEAYENIKEYNLKHDLEVDVRKKNGSRMMWMEIDVDVVKRFLRENFYDCKEKLEEAEAEFNKIKIN